MARHPARHRRHRAELRVGVLEWSLLLLAGGAVLVLILTRRGH
jgi:hypothetical protein